VRFEIPQRGDNIMKTRIPRLAGPTAIAMAALTACGGGGGGSEPAPVAAAPSAVPQNSQPMPCASLANMAIPAAAIGLPTTGATVTSATVVAAAGTGAAFVPEHCLVNASISPVDANAPKIMMRVALPTAWNQKALMYGGGGFDGTIPNVVGNASNGATDVNLPVARGYAVFASDSGHQANARGSLDGTFGLNDEALANWGGNALKKTRDTAAYIIRSRYALNPVKSYFAGGSTGGREALQSVQRWPADWDGVIAWYPAWNQASAMMAGYAGSNAVAKPGAYPSVAKRLALLNASLQACDALDGVADGVVSNQAACNARFDPATATLNGAPLRCAGGADTGDTCLSDAQIAAVKAINSPVKFGFSLASETGHPGYNVWGADLGISSLPTAVAGTVAFLNLGSAAPANPVPAAAPYITQQVDGVLKYMITRDVNFNPLAFDPLAPSTLASRWVELSKMIDISTDFSGFVNKGGKMLLAHGVHDVLVSSRSTEDLYLRQVKQHGQAKVDTFARYYEIPGLGHAVSSQFNGTWDALTALENWAERGIAPANQVTRDTIGVPGRTRPLCDYPKWARYNGTGDVNVAASYTCVVQ
jgi:feruloyl esterase